MSLPAGPGDIKAVQYVSLLDPGQVSQRQREHLLEVSPTSLLHQFLLQDRFFVTVFQVGQDDGGR